MTPSAGGQRAIRWRNVIHASTYIREYPMLTLYIADVEKDACMKKLSREEAAKVLEGMKVKIEIPKAAVTQWERNAALDMAIEALNCSEIPNKSDTISRADAIEQIQTWAVNLINPKMLSREDAIYILESMPSTQPERKKGEWIPYSPEGLRYKCSECESKYDTPWHFCPNCGSYNGGESDDKG